MENNCEHIWVKTDIPKKNNVKNGVGTMFELKTCTVCGKKEWFKMVKESEVQ